jgi:hypothetical protein
MSEYELEERGVHLFTGNPPSMIYDSRCKRNFYRCQPALAGTRSRFQPCTFRTLPVKQENLSSVILRLFHRTGLLVVYGLPSTEF